MRFRSCTAKLIPLLFSVSILGCSGGDDGEIVGTGLDGTAAVGHPLGQATVTIKGSKGITFTTTTDNEGHYKVARLEDSGVTGPLFLKVDAGDGKTLYSIAHVNQGKQNVSNIHPLSDLVARNWFTSKNRDIAQLFSDTNPVANPPDKADITAIAAALKRLLKTAYTDFSVESEFDFMESAFSANSIGFDRLLDYLSVEFVENFVTVRLTDDDETFSAIAIIILNFDISNMLSVPDTAPPSEPTGLLAVPANENAMIVVWNSSEDNVGVAGYNIYRDGDLSTVYATSPYPVFTDTSLAADTEYCYQVQAFDGAENANVSPITTQVCGRTPAVTIANSAPDAISGLQATAISQTQIDLTWNVATDAEDNVIGYDVYRGVAGSTLSKYATVVANAYQDKALLANTEYCYMVKAFDSFGARSADIAQQCATTQVSPETDPPVTMASPLGNTGPFTSAIDVTLSCDDGAGSGCAAIYYTTNGIDPDQNSSQYANPITLSATTVLKFFAVDNNGNQEAVQKQTYDFGGPDVTAPTTTATPAGKSGFFNSVQSVTLSCDDGPAANASGCAGTYYTVNGNDPTTASTPYTGAIAINASAILKYISIDNAGNIEGVNSASYNIDLLGPTTTSSPGENTYPDPQSVTLQCDDGTGAGSSGCANTYYTTNGSDPTTSSAVYSGAIQIATTTTLKFLSIDNAGNVGAIGTDVYTITPTVDPLAVTISLATAPVVSGGRAFYSIKLSNTTLLPMTNLSVDLTVPDGLQFDRSADAVPNATTNCGNNICVPGEVATWSIPLLKSGESKTIELNALVTSGLLNDTQISLPIAVAATELTAPLNVSKLVVVKNDLGVALSLSANKDPVMSGEQYTLRLVMGNFMTVPNLATAQLRVFLPAGVGVNSISDNGTDNGTGEVFWDLNSVALGTSLAREITVTAPDLGAASSAILQARAQLTFDGGLAVDAVAEHAVALLKTQPELQFDISTAQKPVRSNGKVFYSMTLANTSLLPVKNIELLYRTPAGLQFDRNSDAAPNANSNCGDNICVLGEEAIWNIPDLPAGESRTITINASATAAQLDGSIISAPVRVTADELKADMGIIHSVSVVNNPMAHLALSANKDPVLQGQNYTLSLDLGNINTTNLTTTELTVELPAGVSVVNSDAGIVNGNGEIVWNLPDISVGESIHREIVVMAPTLDVATSSGILKARARLNFAGGLDVDAVAEHAITVQNVANPLLLDITTAQSPAVIGDKLFYALTLTNTSLLPVNNIELLYRTPAGLQFNRNADAAPNANSNCGDNICTAGEEVVWSGVNLAAGQSKTFTFNTSVLAGQLAGTVISAPVRVSSNNLKAETDLLYSVAVVNSVAAELALSTDKNPVVQGENFTLKFDLGNISGAALSTTLLTADLPEGVTVVSISDLGSSDNAGHVSWDLSNVNVGESIHREVVVTAPTLTVAESGANLMTRAKLTYAGGLAVDVVAENTVSLQKTTPKLKLDISTAQSPAFANGRLLYTLLVTNTSMLPVTNIELLYRTPAGIQFNRNADAEPNASANCGDNICTQGEEAIWNGFDLASGESKTISFNASVLAGQLPGTVISAPVRVTSLDLTTDIDVTHSVALAGNLATQLVVSSAQSPVVQNTNYTLTFDLGNISATDLVNTVLTATLPAGVTVVSTTGGIANGSEVSWNLGTVVPTATLHEEVVVTAPTLTSAEPGDILKTSARLTYDGGNEVDMSAEHVARLVSAPEPLTLSIVANPNQVAADGTVTYTITVDTASVVAINNVSVLFRVPAGLSFNRNTNAVPPATVNCGNNICDEGEEARWDFASVVAGAPAEITIIATVQPGFTAGTLITTPIRVYDSTQTNTMDILHTVPIIP